MLNKFSFNDNNLNVLWKRGSDFLGSKTAILVGAMTWVSNHSFVSAVSDSGAFGILASGAMTPEILDNELSKITTKNPFGVNIILMNPYIEDLIKTCQKHNVSHIFLAGGMPTKDQINLVHLSGSKAIAFTPTLSIGKKLIKAGIDALIIEGSEAGGHIGPVSTTVLCQEILPNIKEVPIFVAGGIGRGEAIINNLKMGASGCQLGTRFACIKESIAHKNFKEAFFRAKSRDATSSIQIDQRFPVIPVRAISNKASLDFIQIQKETIEKYDNSEITLDEAKLLIEHFWAGALRKAVIDGDIENGSLMAGQSVCFVEKEESAIEVVNALINQAKDFLHINKI